MIKQIKLPHAILSLYPTADFVLRGDEYEGLEWFNTDIEKPTKQELLNEIDRLSQEQIDNQYQQKRIEQYPNIGDQLDMLWHAIDSGTLNKTSNFYTAIKAVKDAYPKSGE